MNKHTPKNSRAVLIFGITKNGLRFRPSDWIERFCGVLAPYSQNSDKESIMKYRIEFDSIGKIKVPGDKYWGASTERSNKYFNIGDFIVRPAVIHSIAIIKKAATKKLVLERPRRANRPRRPELSFRCFLSESPALSIVTVSPFLISFRFISSSL